MLPPAQLFYPRQPVYQSPVPQLAFQFPMQQPALMPTSPYLGQPGVFQPAAVLQPQPAAVPSYPVAPVPIGAVAVQPQVYTPAVREVPQVVPAQSDLFGRSVLIPSKVGRFAKFFPTSGATSPSAVQPQQPIASLPSAVQPQGVAPIVSPAATPDNLFGRSELQPSRVGRFAKYFPAPQAQGVVGQPVAPVILPTAQPQLPAAVVPRQVADDLFGRSVLHPSRVSRFAKYFPDVAPPTTLPPTLVTTPQPVYLPVLQTTPQPAQQPVYQPVLQTTPQPAQQPVYQPVLQTTLQPVTPPTARPVLQTTTQSVQQPVYQPVVQTTPQPAQQSTSQLPSQPTTVPPATTPRPMNPASPSPANSLG